MTQYSHEITRDTMFDGDLICSQHKDGYRFSIDSILLAHFVLHWKFATVLDMGCGCGIIGMILLYKNSPNILHLEGIEYQEKLVSLAKLNVQENKLKDKMHITHGNYVEINKYYKAETFSHVICNPPFYEIGRGRPSKHNEAYLARHQTVSTTVDLAASIAFVLKNRGTMAIVFPAELSAYLVNALKEKKIEPKRFRPVYSYPEATSASLVLLECCKNGGIGMKLLPPLYIYTKRNGEYTEEVKKMYQPLHLRDEEGR
jgi:tRNA1Val (adenine37-N6)-methyltransferase